MDIKVAQPHYVYKHSLELVKIEQRRQKLLLKFKDIWKTSMVPSINMSLTNLQKKFENYIKETKKELKNLRLKIKMNSLQDLNLGETKIVQHVAGYSIGGNNHFDVGSFSIGDIEDDSSISIEEEKECDKEEENNSQIKKKKTLSKDIKDAKACLKIIIELIKLHDVIKQYQKEMINLKMKKRKINSVFMTFRHRKDKELFQTYFPKDSVFRHFLCLGGKRTQLTETQEEAKEKEKEKKKQALFVQRDDKKNDIKEKKLIRNEKKVEEENRKIVGNSFQFQRSLTKRLKTKQITVIDPVDPLNMNWKHLDRSLSTTILRRVIAWVIYLFFFWIGKFFF